MTVHPIPDVVSLTQQLVRIPSVNPMDADHPADICGEWRVTDFLASLLESHGLPVWRDPVLPGVAGQQALRENLLARLDGATGAPTLVLEAHQDTVPTTGMTIPPFSGELREERVWGRGACDVKGSIAAVVTAVLRAAALPPEERPHLVLALTVNEEHGFDGAKQLRRTWHEGRCPLLPAAPDAIVVCEPTDLQVVVAHKGTLHWRCHTSGIAAHSSSPGAGENAIYRMAQVVTVLQRYADEVVPHLAQDPLLGRPTLSVGTIRGGTSVNTVPDHAEIQIDRRLCPSESLEQARQHVIDYLEDQLAPAVARHVQHDPPAVASVGLASSENGELARQLMAAALHLGRACTSHAVPYATDAATLAADGIPTVVFGPGSIAQAHTADEWIATEQLEAAVAVLETFFGQWFRTRPR